MDNKTKLMLMEAFLEGILFGRGTDCTPLDKQYLEALKDIAEKVYNRYNDRYMENEWIEDMVKYYS
jgi:hypothetical protein